MWEFADSFVDFIQINSNLCFEFFRDRAKFNQDLVSLTSYPSPTLLILPSLSLVLLPFVWKETETARRAKQSEELFNSKGLAIAYVLKQRLWKFRKWIIFRKTFVGLWWGRQIFNAAKLRSNSLIYCFTRHFTRYTAGLKVFESVKRLLATFMMLAFMKLRLHVVFPLTLPFGQPESEVRICLNILRHCCLLVRT